MSERTHKLAAIIFTDIVDYTKQMEENEQRTMQLLQQQREIVFPLVKSFGGEIIKEIGDGLLIMFNSAVQAVRFAINLQTRLKDEELTIRAGIHIGDVIFEGGDVFGSAVNTAARIEPLAEPNGICISEDVRSQLHNKTDIITISKGKKELKGVKGSVEIFELFIEGVSVKRSKSLGFIFKDLWRRNVIQILLGYFVAAWIIKQAVAAIVSNYSLSHHLIELSWILLISMVPAVAILSYFHGKRSSGKWTRIELIGLPANIVISAIILVVLFNGKDLGAATEKVTVQNEEGDLITREIPKNEFRKDIAFFFLDNKTQDPGLNWLQYGITTMLQYDISQDIFMDAVNGLNYIQKFKDAGYPDGLNAPLTLKKKIAGNYHKEFFVTGEYNKTEDDWKISVEIYNSSRGTLVNEISYQGTDLFKITDQLSVEVKRAVGLPEQNIQNAEDLPISEIFTSSIPAFESYVKGQLKIILENDYDPGIKLLEKAVEYDPDFVVAHVQLAEFYFNNNAPQKTEASLAVVMDKIYKLPERLQFYAKFFYYLVKQNAEQANAVVKMWTELYPEDIQAKMTMAQRYLMKNDFENTIAEYKKIIELAPEEYEYIKSLGDIYELTGDFDSSLLYYKLYAEKHPDDYYSYKNLGDTYMKLCEFDKSLENYKKALLIEPNNASAVHNLSTLYLKRGEFDMAFEVLSEALPKCKTSEDFKNIYSAYENYYEFFGKINKSFEYFQLKFEEYEKFLPPLRVMVYKTFMISKYSEVNKEEEALQILQKIESEFQPPFDMVSAFGYLFYYIDVKQPEKAETYIDEAMALINRFGEQTLIANIYYAEGRIAELKENYDQAIESYSKFLELQKGSVQSYRWLARSYRKAGDLDNAESYINEALKRSPHSAKTRYEAAGIYLEKGDTKRAREYISNALETWKDADPIYEPYQKAKALERELEQIH